MTLPHAAGAPFTVAVDAGHGGTNLGAPGTGPGIYEKHITLDIARRVRRRLATNPGIRVVMCRDADELLTMRARVRCGNESGARLFMSIHANAAAVGAPRGSQRGFEIFVLPAAGVDHEAGLAAVAAENA